MNPLEKNITIKVNVSVLNPVFLLDKFNIGQAL